MAQVEQEKNKDRLKAAAGVAVFHAVLGWALITGLGYEVGTKISDKLQVFNLPEAAPPPPLEEIAPLEAKAKEPEGAAAPPSVKASPSPVVAPPPKIRLEVPPPVVTSP